MSLVIDSHVHLCSEPLNDEPPQTVGADGQLISFPCIRRECSAESLLGHMDENSVDKAMVMAVEGWITNEQLGKVVAQHPDRLVGFAYISNPLDECRAPALLEHAVTAWGLKGLKMHPGLQGFSPSDARLIPLIQKASELGIPVLFHMHPWPLGNFDFREAGAYLHLEETRSRRHAHHRSHGLSTIQRSAGIALVSKAVH